MALIKNKETKRSFGNKESKMDDLAELLGGSENVFEVTEHIDYIIAVVDGNSDQWLTIKSLLQRYLPVKLRVFLSGEDYSTRKQKPNDFDYAVMNYWKEKTGVELIIPKHKLHPENHIYRPRGWKLAIINELRKRKRIEEGKREPEPEVVCNTGKVGKRGRPKGHKQQKWTKRVVREYFDSLEKGDKGVDQA